MNVKSKDLLAGNYVQSMNVKSKDLFEQSAEENIPHAKLRQDTF
jgi:hypothetical protein